MTIRGQCLCGGMAFEIDGRLSDIEYCHCRMCQKMHGTAFGAYAFCKASAFSYGKGEELLTKYDTRAHFRAFCSVCGSNMPVHRAGSEVVVIPAGAIDGDPGSRPVRHIFASYRAPWHEITDDIRQYEEGAAYGEASEVAP